MYDMYPEWGPAKNRTDDRDGAPMHPRAGTHRSWTDPRDESGERPDDN